LAKHLIEKRKKKVLTVSGDVYRPAAIEQLKTVTAQAGAEWFPSSPDQKPADIARAALDYARRHFIDVLLVDTAGRLAIDEALMAEIKELHTVLNPVETLFVVDAMQGQDAINTARAFKEALPLTGIILTKTDGDSRGGSALSVRAVTGVPIKFAGVSEKLTAWRYLTPTVTPRAFWVWAIFWPWWSKSPPMWIWPLRNSWPPRSKAERVLISTTFCPKFSK
jgi:signal recognition particle subunit SRP54